MTSGLVGYVEAGPGTDGREAWFAIDDPDARAWRLVRYVSKAQLAQDIWDAGEWAACRYRGQVTLNGFYGAP